MRASSRSRFVGVAERYVAAPLGPRTIDRALGELGWTGQVEQAVTWWERLLGMTVRAPLDAAGRPRIMALPRCRSVHTWFMRYPLDIAFIDRAGSVLARHDGVACGRVVSCPGAAAVLERAAVAPDAASVRHPAAWRVGLPCCQSCGRLENPA